MVVVVVYSMTGHLEKEKVKGREREYTFTQLGTGNRLDLVARMIACFFLS